MKTIRNLALGLVAAATFAAPAFAGTKEDEAAIAKALNDGCAATEARDPAGMMAPFKKDNPDLTVFDWHAPRSRNYQQLWDANEAFAKAGSKTVYCKYLEIHPTILSKDAAYSWAVLEAGGETTDGKKFDYVMRSTDVWRKIKGEWKIVHEHNSFPADTATGMADYQSKP